MSYPFPNPVPAPWASRHVQAVHTELPFRGVESITHLLIEGVIWTRQGVVHAIDRGEAFHTFVNGRSVPLEAVTNPVTGTRYVRTRPDGFYDNNLLALPRF